MVGLSRLLPDSPRGRFILYGTLGYFICAMAWILLSDALLRNFKDVNTIVWFSSVKGAFFIIATTAMLRLALRIVGNLPATGSGSVTDVLAHGKLVAERPNILAYALATALPVSVLVLRQTLGDSSQPLIIMLVLPVIISALYGGLLPGLLSTAIAIFGIHASTQMPNSFQQVNDRYAIALAMLLLNGVAVSVLSELRRQAQAKADENRELLNAIVSGTTDAAFVKDLKGRYLLINAAGARMVRKTPAEVVDKDDTNLFPLDEAIALMASDRAIMERGITQTHEESWTFPDGVDRDLLVTKGPVWNRQGEVTGLFGIAHDITERKRAEMARLEAATVFECSHEGIMIVDKHMRIVKVNPAFTNLTGYSAGEAMGQSPHLLSSGQHDGAFFRNMWTALHQQGYWRGEILNRRKNGQLFAELLSISTVRDSDSQVQFYVGSFTDISKHKEHAQELNRIAHYDPLTGLPNRRLLTDRLEQALRSTVRDKRMLAVCLLDLDHFKFINSQHNHAVGDALLMAVSQSLAHELRTGDVLAHLGGDEFVMLLANMESPEACSQALDRVLHAVSRPLELPEGSFSITASIGVALYPQDDANADTLLRHADQAMYRAKESGRNRYHLFDAESDRRAQEHRHMLDILRKALQNGEFTLYYQPKVDMLNGQVTGAEALIRWQHPERGVLAPAAFLDHINGSDLETALGQWVIDTAMDQVEQWHLQGLDLRVSVNISANHLLQPDFCKQLQASLMRHPHLPATNFELEVLETVALADMEQAVALVGHCKQLGVHFALDDFGTGYSSLSYLRRLPVDELKIDQSFVRDMLTDDDDRGIVQAVVQLASVFNRQVIAEGVETLAHGAALLALGCRHGQGYGIAKPMPAQDFQDWLARWQREAPWKPLGSPP